MGENTNYFETNRATWNKKVAVHAQSDMYDMEAFKSGKSSLMPYELNALGDVIAPEKDNPFAFNMSSFCCVG